MNAQAHTTPTPGTATPAQAAPFTLRFTEWRCGHHGERPADIPVRSIEQAQAILSAISHAISQPGSAHAVLYAEERCSNTVYLTDDYAEKLPPFKDWAWRTVVHHGSAAELEELMRLQAAYEYAYGGEMPKWDGKAYLDGLEAATTLSVAEIEAAIAPVEWHEGGLRTAVCDAPPVLKPAAELLAELREVAAEMEQEGGAA